MPLELRKGRDGKLIPKWYGRYEIRGKRYVVTLCDMKGTPPESMSIRKPGDDTFEKSRIKAQAALDAAIENARRPHDAAHLVERIYELKTGERMKSVLLTGLAEDWAKVPRRRKPNPQYAKQCTAVINRFVAFMKANHPRATELPMVSRDMALAFLDAEDERKASNKTWNDTLKLLRAVCKYLLPNGAVNPFVGIPTRETETMFRKPFTPAELQRILEEAGRDAFIRPLIVTGICTAMRRGDCCLLKWADVELDNWFITVKTSKTGETVEIPIFPMLHDELEMARRAQAGIGAVAGNRYCFPEAAEMYKANADGITWRVKKVLTRAFTDDDAEQFPELSEDETRERGLTYLAGLPESKKTERMKRVFEMYMDRRRTKDIEAECGVTKGSVSGYLNEIENAAQCRIVRGRNTERSVTARAKTDREILHSEREVGTRRASVRDFHSFRVTWVTLALTAGMPLELVQRVTGHKTTDIVLKHYFRPGREDFRKALENAMPRLFTEGVAPKALPGRVISAENQPYAETASPGELLEQALQDLATVKSKNKRLAAAVKRVKQAKEWIDQPSRVAAPA